MRYIPWFILAYVVLGLQSGLSPYISIDGSPPNLLLPVAIFIALYAPRDAALLGTYVLGLMQDMLSLEPLGVHALVYAAVTLGVRYSQPLLFREHWITHLLLGLTGGVLHAMILVLVGFRLAPAPPIMMLATYVLYTTAITPLMLYPLQKCKRFFGFQAKRNVPGRV